MSQYVEHLVNTSNIRLDKYLTALLDSYSRTKIRDLIDSGNVSLDGSPVKPSYILKGGEVLEYCTDFPSPEIKEYIESEDIDIDILYEDESIIAVNKPPGLVVHPGSGNWSGTLLNGVISKLNFDDINSNPRPGIVHRLDKFTSGVMIVAKTPQSHFFISEQFSSRKVKKEYRAIVWGGLDDSGNIEGKIERSRKNRKTFLMSNSETGRDSLTTYKLIEDLQPLTYASLFPKTGRTHQLRVHMKHIGHPIFFDSIYSGGENMIKSFHIKHTPILKRLFNRLKRLMLHAYQIEIIHPDTKESIQFSAPLPDDIELALKVLRNES